MDERRFDVLSRMLGSAPSRRSALGGLVSAALGSVAAGLGIDSAVAKKHKKGKKKKNNGKKNDCKKNEKKCGGKCIPKGNCCNNGDCGECEVCESGTCTSTCAAGQSCQGGQCTCGGAACEGCCNGTTCLGGSSFDACGSDGVVCFSCGAGQTCQGGQCVCNATSCAGCCDGSTCRGGGNVEHCGQGGEACQECEGDEICSNGSCEPPCPTGQKLCEGVCIDDEEPCFRAVTDDNLRGWLLFGEDPFSNDPSLTQIVDGPDDPPAPGEGSVKLNPTAFNGFNEDQTQAVLRTLQYEGTAVEDIARLEYSIYVPATVGDPPTMQLAVVGEVGSFNSEGFASLVFIPGANGNTAFDEDDWTNYTPSDSGFWVSTRDLLGPSDECLMCRSIGNAHEGGCLDVGICNANKTKTWAQIQAAIPNAELNDSGSFSFRIGRGDIGEGNVTNVVFNDDGYYFEEV